jgi:hypothetical protein
MAAEDAELGGGDDVPDALRLLLQVRVPGAAH